jgi:hypothetical protein
MAIPGQVKEDAWADPHAGFNRPVEGTYKAQLWTSGLLLGYLRQYRRRLDRVMASDITTCKQQ